ncbi:putative amino-acid ABC transporter permease protein PatM [Pseudomonas reidholzensis]|uniref:Putative amino-acid ABC transporter permease protein PatM n=1 Tax=Pseudomonas reidholzensis TaxID=1785162 RepID=A0A383S3L7_9PSED|nr:putative amino-acid ABC transporter permease protein PatM [Pseudomonas reidholzensis]
MNFDTAFMLSTLPAFGKAVGVTLQVGLIAIATSLLVAVLNATILVLRTPYLWRAVQGYVELARNTPLLIQLFFIYFALPTLGVKVSGFAAAIITMTFMGGAYLTEVLRAGVESSSRGARSACRRASCCVT